MKSLTVFVITSRKEPEIKWLKDSLALQLKPDDNVDLQVVSLYQMQEPNVLIHEPKPNVWQGRYKLTKDEWWAVCSARNAAICLCKSEYVMFLDDRCVLQPGFMDAVREAVAGNYIMAGRYEKRKDMTVENGIIKNGGIITAVDSRQTYCIDRRIPMPFSCGGEWLFGCCVLMPLEWALQVNGYPERCDSSSMEDVIFGLILQNNKFPIKFDSRAKMIEDRSPEFIGTPMRRESREKHPHDTNDRNHVSLRWVKTAMRSDNDFDIRELRANIQAGGEFPIPNNPDAKDWFDGKLIREIV